MEKEIEEEQKEVISESEPVNRDMSSSFREDSNKGYKNRYFKNEK